MICLPLPIKTAEVKVRGDYTVQFDGDAYKVFDIPGIAPRMSLEAHPCR